MRIIESCMETLWEQLVVGQLAVRKLERFIYKYTTGISKPVSIIQSI